MSSSDDEYFRELANRRGEGDGNKPFVRRTRDLEDFRYDETQEKFWDVTTGVLLGAKSVDGAVPEARWPLAVDRRSGDLRPRRPSLVLPSVDTGLTVEGSTWWPGLPQFVQNVVVTERGVQRLDGAVCYNRYQPPVLDLSGATDPDPWIEHVRRLYPVEEEHELLFDFAAHALQRPDEKVNWAIVLAGDQGIGKDTLLDPLRFGVGAWNAAEISPDIITQAYNGYLLSVLLVINEVRPHDEDHKAANFYNMLKPLLASPPEMLPLELKYQNRSYVRNLCHVILTTNEMLGMYVPEDDRRMFILSSANTAEAIGGKHYFDQLYNQLNSGGREAAVQWLLDRDLKDFRPKEPPPETAAKARVIASNTHVRRTLVDDVLEMYIERFETRPEVIFHRDLVAYVAESELFDDQQSATKQLNARNFHFKMAAHGYELVKNPASREWRRGQFRTRSAFVRRELPETVRVHRVTAALEARTKLN